MKKLPPLRRFFSFSLRELCLLMLTVAAFAGWWRAMPYSGRPDYSNISMHDLEKAVKNAAAEHFAEQKLPCELAFLSDGGGTSKSSRRRSVNVDSRSIIRFVPPHRSKISLQFEHTGSGASPLHVAIVTHLVQELESIPNVTVGSAGGFSSQTYLTETLMYDFKGIKGVLYVRIRESPVRKHIEDMSDPFDEIEATTEGGISRLDVEIMLLEMPVDVRK